MNIPQANQTYSSQIESYAMMVFQECVTEHFTLNNQSHTVIFLIC
jgi:hypothetical protein